jgi:uncharacterized protein (DUF1778 family)
MSRLSIELTTEQHQRLKAVAALQGKSIKEYVLERVLSPISHDSAADEALVQLEAFLQPRLDEAIQGKFVNRSVSDIFEEEIRKLG